VTGLIRFIVRRRSLASQCNRSVCHTRVPIFQPKAAPPREKHVVRAAAALVEMVRQIEASKFSATPIGLRWHVVPQRTSHQASDASPGRARRRSGLDHLRHQPRQWRQPPVPHKHGELSTVPSAGQRRARVLWQPRPAPRRFKTRPPSPSRWLLIRHHRVLVRRMLSSAAKLHRLRQLRRTSDATAHIRRSRLQPHLSHAAGTSRLLPPAGSF
jgi:hypothetical protein